MDGLPWPARLVSFRIISRHEQPHGRNILWVQPEVQSQSVLPPPPRLQEDGAAGQERPGPAPLVSLFCQPASCRRASKNSLPSFISMGHLRQPQNGLAAAYFWRGTACRWAVAVVRSTHVPLWGPAQRRRRLLVRSLRNENALHLFDCRTRDPTCTHSSMSTCREPSAHRVVPSHFTHSLPYLTCPTVDAGLYKH